MNSNSKVRRRSTLAALVLVCGYEFACLMPLPASAQGSTEIQCIQRTITTATPPPAPPAPRTEAAETNIRRDPTENQALINPVCPEGQIPMLPSAPRSNAAPSGSLELKGNPLLRPQVGIAQPRRARAATSKFLHFEDVYRKKPSTRSRNEDALSHASGVQSKCPNFQDNACFYYASSGVQKSDDGGGMTISVDSPAYINPGAQGHTLNEISVQGGPKNGDIVELGWLISTDQNGDSDPHIFVFHWINWNGTCYDACGWQQFSSKYYPGQNVSALKGREVYVGYVFYQGNWWAWFDNQWLGYFPGSLWQNGYTKVTLIQWFGEVATSSSAPPQIQMGDGILPPPPTAAHMFTLCEVDAKAWVCDVRDQQILASPTVAKYYDIRRVGAGETRYGGPGK